MNGALNVSREFLISFFLDGWCSFARLCWSCWRKASVWEYRKHYWRAKEYMPYNLGRGYGENLENVLTGLLLYATSRLKMFRQSGDIRFFGLLVFCPSVGIVEVGDIFPGLMSVFCSFSQLSFAFSSLFDLVVSVSNVLQHSGCVFGEGLSRVVAFTASVPTNDIVDIVAFSNVAQSPFYSAPQCTVVFILIRLGGALFGYWRHHNGGFLFIFVSSNVFILYLNWL